MEADLAWIEDMLHMTEQRLVKLSAMKAPDVILENERKIIARRKAWVEAWYKDHPIPADIYETQGPPDPEGRVRKIVREDRDAGY